MSTLDEFDRLALMVPCPYCGAVVGEGCVTRSGAPSRWLHGKRSDPIIGGWRHGWTKRTNDLMRWYISDPRDFARYAARWARENVKPTP